MPEMKPDQQITHLIQKTADELATLLSYPAPHCGLPGEVGGSAPRGSCAAISSEVTAFYSGQTNGTFTARDSEGKYLGRLDYQYFDGEVLVAWIEVEDAYRRQGIGTQLFDALKEEFPEATINTGTTTDAGTTFFENVLPSGIQTPGAKLTSPHAGMASAFKIDVPGGARISGYLHSADFPGEYSDISRGEIFYVEVPEKERRTGLATSLVKDALRLMVEAGTKTVNMNAVSEGGAALIKSLQDAGWLEHIRGSEMGKAEYTIVPHLIQRHYSETHPGTGTDQDVHAGANGSGGSGKTAKDYIETFDMFPKEGETRRAHWERFVDARKKAAFAEVEKLGNDLFDTDLGTFMAGGWATDEEILAEIKADPRYADLTEEEQNTLGTMAYDAGQDRKAVYIWAVKRARAEGVLSDEDIGKMDLTYETRPAHGREWEDLPDTLYHVTTAADAIRENGLKSRFELLASTTSGLGGGTDDTISFTGDYEIAQNIERAFHEARLAATGEFTYEDMLRQAVYGVGADKPYIGMLLEKSETYMQRLDDAATDDPDAVWESHRVQAEIKSFQRNAEEKSLGEVSFDFYSHGWARARQWAGGPQDPLFWGADHEIIAAQSPDDFVILEYQPADNAQGYQMGSLGEWRTYGDRHIEFVREINSIESDEEIVVRTTKQAVALPGAMSLPLEWIKDEEQDKAFAKFEKESAAPGSQPRMTIHIDEKNADWIGKRLQGKYGLTRDEVGRTPEELDDTEAKALRKYMQDRDEALKERHYSETHPGTGTDQDVHGGGAQGTKKKKGSGKKRLKVSKNGRWTEAPGTDVGWLVDIRKELRGLFDRGDYKRMGFASILEPLRPYKKGSVLGASNFRRQEVDGALDRLWTIQGEIEMALERTGVEASPKLRKILDDIGQYTEMFDAEGAEQNMFDLLSDEDLDAVGDDIRFYADQATNALDRHQIIKRLTANGDPTIFFRDDDNSFAPLSLRIGSLRDISDSAMSAVMAGYFERATTQGTPEYNHLKARYDSDDLIHQEAMHVVEKMVPAWNAIETPEHKAFNDTAGAWIASATSLGAVMATEAAEREFGGEATPRTANASYNHGTFVHGHDVGGEDLAKLTDVDRTAYDQQGADDFMNAPEVQAAGDAAVREIYERAQERLADYGFAPDDTIRLYRGMGTLANEEWNPLGGTGEADVQMYALSSWSESVGTASGFATDDGNKNGAVVVADIPVSEIFSTPSTGWGSQAEGEYLVLGGDGIGARVYSASTPSSHIVNMRTNEEIIQVNADNQKRLDAALLKMQEEYAQLKTRHAAPIHPGTGTDQSVHAGTKSISGRLSELNKSVRNYFDWEPENIFALNGGSSGWIAPDGTVYRNEHNSQYTNAGHFQIARLAIMGAFMEGDHPTEGEAYQQWAKDARNEYWKITGLAAPTADSQGAASEYTLKRMGYVRFDVSSNPNFGAPPEHQIRLGFDFDTPVSSHVRRTIQDILFAYNDVPVQYDVDLWARDASSQEKHERNAPADLVWTSGDRVNRLFDEIGVVRHAAPIHPGTGTDQSVHAGNGGKPKILKTGSREFLRTRGHRGPQDDPKNWPKYEASRNNSIKAKTSLKEFFEDRLIRWGADVTKVGYGPVIEFYDNVQQRSPKGTYIRTDDAVLLIHMFDDDWMDISVTHMFAKPLGTGLGTSAMYALKDLAILTNRLFSVDMVANHRFFNRFSSWLKPKGDDPRPLTYTYDPRKDPYLTERSGGPPEFHIDEVEADWMADNLAHFDLTREKVDFPERFPEDDDLEEDLEDYRLAKKEASALVQRHHGPGTHPGTGTEQTVHAGGDASTMSPRMKRNLANTPLNTIWIDENSLSGWGVDVQTPPNREVIKWQRGIIKVLKAMSKDTFNKYNAVIGDLANIDIAPSHGDWLTAENAEYNRTLGQFQVNKKYVHVLPLPEHRPDRVLGTATTWLENVWLLDGILDKAIEADGLELDDGVANVLSEISDYADLFDFEGRQEQFINRKGALAGAHRKLIEDYSVGADEAEAYSIARLLATEFYTQTSGIAVFELGDEGSVLKESILAVNAPALSGIREGSGSLKHGITDDIIYSILDTWRERAETPGTPENAISVRVAEGANMSHEFYVMDTYEYARPDQWIPTDEATEDLQYHAQWGNDGWAKSTQTLPAIAISESVARMFGGESVPRERSRDIGQETSLDEDDTMSLTDEWVKAVYDRTQALLAEGGLGSNDTLRLYRGMGTLTDKRWNPAGDEGPAIVQMWAASSWSSSMDSALTFASYGTGALVVADIPASRILAMPSTGFPCKDEAEYVVLGQDGIPAYVFDPRASIRAGELSPERLSTMFDGYAEPTVERHHGPGPHPSGSEQTAHAGNGTGQDIYIGVPNTVAEPGTKASDMNRLGIQQGTGAPVRGTVISPTDDRISDHVYHMTTDLPAVRASQELSARGAGGLGGDKKDQIVSMTIDKGIADQLADDMRFAIQISKEFIDSEPEHKYLGDGDWQAYDKEGNEVDYIAWNIGLHDRMNELAHSQGVDYTFEIFNNARYSIHDWFTQYFIHRNSDKYRNPLFYTDPEYLAGLDASKIGVVSIPSENLDTGALLTDLDLGRNNLEEVRLYGDVPMEGAQYTDGDGMTFRHHAPIHPGTGTDQSVHGSAAGVSAGGDYSAGLPASLTQIGINGVNMIVGADDKKTQKAVRKAVLAFENTLGVDLSGFTIVDSVEAATIVQRESGYLDHYRVLLQNSLDKFRAEPPTGFGVTEEKIKKHDARLVALIEGPDEDLSAHILKKVRGSWNRVTGLLYLNPEALKSPGTKSWTYTLWHELGHAADHTLGFDKWEPADKASWRRARTIPDEAAGERYGRFIPYEDRRDMDTGIPNRYMEKVAGNPWFSRTTRTPMGYSENAAHAEYVADLFYSSIDYELNSRDDYKFGPRMGWRNLYPLEVDDLHKLVADTAVAAEAQGIAVQRAKADFAGRTLVKLPNGDGTYELIDTPIADIEQFGPGALVLGRPGDLLAFLGLEDKAVERHAAPIHPGTGTDQSVHAGDGGGVPEGVHPSLDEAAFDMMLEIADTIRNTDNETIYVLTDSGKLSKKTGGEMAVSVSEEESVEFYEKPDGEASFTLHNHPNPQAFSTQDLSAFAYNGKQGSVSMVTREGSDTDILAVKRAGDDVGDEELWWNVIESGQDMDGRLIEHIRPLANKANLDEWSASSALVNLRVRVLVNEHPGWFDFYDVTLGEFAPVLPIAVDDITLEDIKNAVD